eukprot:TRINITY_DN77050_c0_g1_i1.p1 TRINITY_DN77050_c0_g1~~TRINITY_DN77050_c0_g1_i1.p1  ORF type:complete len:320 (+),score=14.92 TRINITY_DN77050_c0_g1_i1:56-1015(+)
MPLERLGIFDLPSMPASDDAAVQPLCSRCEPLCSQEDDVDSDLVDDIALRILKQSRVEVDKGLQENNVNDTFENEDNPEVSYDFDVVAPPIYDSLANLTVISSFLAGFVATEFSGFDTRDWDGVHWVLPVTYMASLAFAQGCCLHLALCGTMASVVYHRCRNQLFRGFWEDSCRAAVQPVTDNLAALKGRRMKLYRQAVSSMIQHIDDYRNNYLLGGLVTRREDIVAKVKIRRVLGENGRATYVLVVNDPALALGQYLGFKYARSTEFPIAMCCHFVALTLKVCRGTFPAFWSTVAAIVAFWLVRTKADFLSFSRKMHD